MRNIALIAPTNDIYVKAKKILDKKGISEIDLYEITFPEVLDFVDVLVQRGYEIIISRGGVYEYIEANYDFVMVEIKVDASDLIRVLSPINEVYKNIGIVGYNRMIEDIDCVNLILENKVKKFPIRNYNEMDELITNISNDGVDYIIGDTFIYNVIRSLSLKGSVLESNEQSIEVAIEEAMSFYNYSTTLKKRIEERQTTINSVPQGIIVLDKNGIITDYNNSASNILDIDKNDICDEKIENVFYNLNEKDVYGKQKKDSKVLEYKNKNLFVDINRITYENDVIGSVLTFQDARLLQESELILRSEMYKDRFIANHKFDDLVYDSASMIRTIKAGKKYGKYDTPIYITGDLGTGKSTMAESIHNYSPRRGGPFVKINCLALTEDIMQNELFGTVKRSGLIERAHKGTLYLEELTAMPLSVQGRLYRILSEGEFAYAGSTELRPVDIRVISSSTDNIEDAVKEGRVIKELYYLLKVLEIKMPTINERGFDVVLLLEHFLDHYSEIYSLPKVKLEGEIISKIMDREYKGNIRELSSIAERATIEGSLDFMRDEHSNFDIDNVITLKELEMEYIQKIFSQNDENVNITSEQLGISRTTLWRKLKEIEEN